MILVSWRPPGEARRPLGAVLERSWGLLEHLGSHLEASWAILSHLGGHLGLSEALLEPSWAILDAPTTRGTARPGPGDGGSGEGYKIFGQHCDLADDGKRSGVYGTRWTFYCR